MRHWIGVGFVLVTVAVTAPAITAAPARRQAAVQQIGALNLDQRPTVRSQERMQQLNIRRQGNDSNCDFIAVQNGIQNIGGDGAAAYAAARALIPQRARDYRESYYTELGPNGSERPFSSRNLGTAPEAFTGIYEALGYNAVMLAAQAGAPDGIFAQTVVDRLAANPYDSFAHVWLTQFPFNARARTVVVPETGERVPLLYPYHEVVLFAVPDARDRVIVLDGLVGRPYVMSVDTLATQLRGFNRLLVVSRSGNTLAEHQRAQIAHDEQPYATQTLGGAYLYAARQLWGPAYAQWGAVIGHPLRASDGPNPTVVLPGEFVHYERVGNGPVTLALLGTRVGHELEAAGVLPELSIRPWEARELPPGTRAWAEGQFGSVSAFERSFGRALTSEFWISQEQMKRGVMRGLAHPIIDHVPSGDGFIVVLTERAMLAWHVDHGPFMVPLGRAFYEQIKQELAPR